MGGNPLVAGPVNTTSPIAGTGLLEDLTGTAQAIENKDWVGAALSGFSSAADVVAAAMDPIGTLIAWGAGFLLDHLQPLKGWLNDLTGDAGAVAGFAETWINVGNRMGEEATFLVNRVNSELDGLTGAPMDAYRTYASDLSKQIAGMQQASDAVAGGLQTASTIVQVVHELVRDTLAQIIGGLGSAIIQAVASFGVLVPKVIADVSAKVASLSGRISRTVTAVVEAMGKLKTLVKKLGDTMDELRSLFRHADDGPSVPHAPKGDTPTTPVRNGDPDAPPTRQNADAPGSTRSPDETPDCGDPVDVATGRVVMDQTDLELPGGLPVRLSRRHLSGYRYPLTSGGVAGWFGDGWVSLFDERLVADSRGVVLVRADGAHLSYPTPELGGDPVLPVGGTARWPLAHDAEGYRVHDPLTGRTRHFDEVVAEAAATDGGERTAMLARLTDPVGRWVDVVRDPAGAPTHVRTSGGYEVVVTTAEGRVTSLSATDRGSRIPVASFGYAGGLLVEVRSGEWPAPTRFRYDDAARLVQWQDSNAVSYSYSYDERGRCTWQSADNGDLAYTYDWSGHDRADRRDAETGERVTVAVDSLGHRTRFVVDENRRLVAEVDALGARTTFGHDDLGRRTVVVDALGHTTRFGFDAAGNTTRVDYADGTRVAVVLDRFGTPAELTMRDGGRWHYAFDARRLPVTEVDPAGGTTSYGYDERGFLSSVTDSLGGVTGVVCDGAGLPVRTVDPTGAVTAYERDGLGRIVVAHDASGATTHYAWDVAGRLVSRTTADGGETRWVYDGEGNLTSHVDAAGRTTTMTYAGFDRIASRVTADGSTTRYAWDAELRLLGVTNPDGSTWSYERDAVGRIVSETDVSGRTVRYDLDATGLVLARHNGAGQSTHFTYDAMGDVVGKETSDGVATRFSYAAGRLVSARRGDVELSRRYDACGRLVAETVDGRESMWSRDAAGRTVGRTTPSGEHVEWKRDAVGAVIALVTGAHRVDVARDAAGREVSRTTGSGVVIGSAYDLMDRLVSRTVGDVDLVRSRVDYSYTATGELTAAVDSRRGTTRYALDGAGRVTAVLDGTGTEGHDAADPFDGAAEQYAYDRIGNVTESAWAATTATSDAAASATQGARTFRGALLASAGRDHFTYDDDSRLVGRDRALLSGGTRSWRYVWDGEDRMVSATTPDGVTWTYAYDALGRRVRKERRAADGSVDEVTTFVWDDFTLVEQVTHRQDSAGAVGTTWFHLGSTPVAQTRVTADSDQTAVDVEFYSIVTDLVGTPTMLLTEGGESAWRASANLWGLGRGAGATTELMPLRFPGQYADDETGLYYNVFRHYDPATGRYATTDPLGLVPQANPYAYPRNPHALVDPLGLTPCTPDPSRNAALNQAKDDLGIPRSQQPDSVERVPMTDRNGRVVLGPDHQPIMTREYHYTRPNGDEVVIQDHGAGHQFGEGGVGDQGPHHNVRPPEDTRNGRVPGTREHYPFTR